MRMWLIALLGVALLWCLVARPLRGYAIPKVLSILLALALIPTATLELIWQQTEQTGSHIVAEVSGKRTGHLHCERFTEALMDLQQRSGEVRLDQPDRAFMTWDTCRALQGFLMGDKHNPSIQEITAIHVLVHESVHVSGEYNEAKTECLAIARDPQVMHELGASTAEAQVMAQRYLSEIYPRLGTEYRTDCSMALQR
jgi:hypothetical protein